MFETDRALRVAKTLLSLKCVQIDPQNPFTYASGLKGPIYTDNRQVLSHVKERLEIFEGLCDLARETEEQFDAVAGLATAGIPHGMMVAHILGLPFIYIRSKSKAHGKANQIEGKYEPGQKILLVEDLVNQGSSLDKAVVAAKEAGLNPTSCVCVVDYQMPAAKKVAERHQLKLLSLTSFSHLSHAAATEGGFNKDSVKLLETWHKDPANWP